MGGVELIDLIANAPNVASTILLAWLIVKGIPQHVKAMDDQARALKNLTVIMSYHIAKTQAPEVIDPDENADFKELIRLVKNGRSTREV